MEGGLFCVSTAVRWIFRIGLEASLWRVTRPLSTKPHRIPNRAALGSPERAPPPATSDAVRPSRAKSPQNADPYTSFSCEEYGYNPTRLDGASSFSGNQLERRFRPGSKARPFQHGLVFTSHTTLLLAQCEKSRGLGQSPSLHENRPTNFAVEPFFLKCDSREVREGGPSCGVQEPQKGRGHEREEFGAAYATRSI